MTRRQFAGLAAALLLAVAVSYLLAPGLAALVLITGVFALAVGDHRSAERAQAARERAQRLAASAQRGKFGGESWRN